MNEDDNTPLTFFRALRAPEFWLFLAGSVASLIGVAGFVVIPLSVAALSIASLAKFIELWPRAQDVGAEWAWWVTVVASMLNDLAASCGVFVLGKFVRWLWW